MLSICSMILPSEKKNLNGVDFKSDCMLCVLFAFVRLSSSVCSSVAVRSVTCKLAQTAGYAAYSTQLQRRNGL